jgi:hypothetical protein
MGAEQVDATRLKWSDGASYTPSTLRGYAFKKFEMWRRLSAERALRYNCLQNLVTGEYRICTVDFVDPNGVDEHNQSRYFVQAFLAIDMNAPGPWYGSLEQAIADHDVAFGLKKKFFKKRPTVTKGYS